LILDVFNGEPSIDQALASSADIITPHIAGYSLQGKLNGTTQVAAAFRLFFGLPTSWQPTHPGPARPDIEYPGPSAVSASPVSDSVFRQHCLASAYDMIADDRRLRLSFLEADPGRAFDRLRRDYPIRHEFTEFRVKGVPEEKREFRSRLSALGFQVI